MTTETKRDLNADLALCEAASDGTWQTDVDGFQDPCVTNGKYLIASELFERDAKFIAESREGWPESLRRAIAAETRLREAEAEVERLREALMTVMHVSKWDGISHELDRCYSIARDALEEVTADATR